MTANEPPTGSNGRSTPVPADLSRLVGFLGPAASYTHQATLGVFSQEKWQLCPAATITDVFEQVQHCRVFQGVVPFENSTHGGVLTTLDCLADRSGRYQDIVVRGEIYLDVRHCLLGIKAPPESSLAVSDDATAPQRPDLQHIKNIHTHPQAFGQCGAFVSRNLRGAQFHESSSTSRAAELVKLAADDASVAIASKLTADVYGLDVLAESIQDRDDNVTRFLILGNASRDPTRQPGPSSPPSVALDTKSLVAFTVPHDAPGALADALSCFKQCGLNLTSINSRPSLRVPFEYVFLVEVRGHRYAADGAVERALGMMDGFVESSRWLGSWETRRLE